MRVATQTSAHRPAVLLLGDSRSRWVTMWVANYVCDSRLRCGLDPSNGNIPRCSPSASEVDVAMDGGQNWRAGGGFLCANTSSISALAYFLHYGVAPSGPYQDNSHTWHHKGDLRRDSNVSSHRIALAALWRFRQLVGQATPLHVIVSSLSWDLIRCVLPL